jgi:hypothetical protein
MGSFEVHSEVPTVRAGSAQAVTVQPLVAVGSEARDVSAAPAVEALPELVGPGDLAGPETVIILQQPALDLRPLERSALPAQPGMGKGQPAPPDGEVEGPSWTAARVSVVIPALNEAKNLPHVLNRLPEGLHQVILVDGFSQDSTIEVARTLRPGIEVVRQDRRGKGNALAHGFAAVTGDVVVMLDADGSADPAEIPAFVQALVDGADFAKGSRFAPGGGSADITRLRRIGNLGLNGIVNVLYGTRYTDLCYGYNAFWCRLLPVLDLDRLRAPATERLWGDGFEIETLINVRIARAGMTVAEVASYEHARLHGVSNLHTFRDGSRVLRTIFRERRHVRRRGVAAGAIAVALISVFGGHDE